MSLRQILRYPQVAYHRLTSQRYLLVGGDEALGLSPARLIAQIVLLQVFFYATAYILLVVTALFAGLYGGEGSEEPGQHRPEQFLVAWVLAPLEMLRLVANTLTITVVLVYVAVNAILAVFVLIVLRVRSKIVWDLAVTLHVITFIVDCVYEGRLPLLVDDWVWLVLEVLSCLFMVWFLVVLSRWWEVRDEFFLGLVVGGSQDVELGVIEPTKSTGAPAA